MTQLNTHRQRSEIGQDLGITKDADEREIANWLEHILSHICILYPREGRFKSAKWVPIAYLT